MKKLLAIAVLSASTVVIAEQHKTTIESRHRDDKIMIDNEFIGYGKVTLNIGDVADTYVDNDGVMRAKRRMKIKAMPGSHGECVGFVSLQADERIPKKTLLDTNLCIRTPSIDVNVN